MFCYVDRFTTASGDALPGYRVRVLHRTTGAIIPIFADENSTPIITVSGITNTAVQDELGNFTLFVPHGIYSVELLDTSGNRVQFLRYKNLAGDPEAVTSAAASALAASNSAVQTASDALVTAANVATTTAARDATLGITNYRATFAEAIADFAVDEYFSTAETGVLRVYKRTAFSPFYVDQGDAAAPLTKASAAITQQASLDTLYIDPLSTGLIAVTPANLRTGLSSATMTGGGFVEELTITVTGTAGSAVLTTADTAKVAGLGTEPFEAALNSADRTGGGDDFFATVRGHNGSTTITLDRPLERAFTGTLHSKYDAALGQHLTKAGYRALAQFVAKANGLTSSRGGIIAGDWADRPAVKDSGITWAKNAALTAVGEINDGTFNVVARIETAFTAGNVLIPPNDFPFRATGLAGTGFQVGTHGAGQGAVATVRLGRTPCVLDFCTAAMRATSPDLSAAGVVITTEVVVDGRVVYTATSTENLRQHLVPVSAADSVEIRVTNTAGGVYYLSLTEFTVREAGVGGGISGKKVLLFGDSWFTYNDAEFGRAFAAKTGLNVVTRALGGMTTEWAKAWFDLYVRDEKPDVCIIHFYTNDSNRLGANTYVPPGGGTAPLWPYTAGTDPTSALTREHWRQNMLLLASRCQQLGIRPAIILPVGTASFGQMQEHQTLRVYLDRGYPADSYQATATEAANPAAFVNTRGKYRGKPLIISGTGVRATGNAAADPWTDPAGATALGAFRLAASLATYTIASGFTIGGDTVVSTGNASGDGLSDGLFEQPYGVVTGDVYNKSIVGGRQRYESVYAASGASGNSRLRFQWTHTAGKRIFTFFEVSNATSGLAFDGATGVTASTLTFAAAGYTTSITGTAGFLYGLETAAAGTRSIFLNSLRANGATRTFDTVRAVAVDYDLLLADAPILASYTNAQLMTFIAGMLP